MQLRRTLTSTTVGLGLITLTACVALVLSTTLLRRTVDDLDRAHAISRLASSLTHQSIRFEMETTPMGRSLSEAQGRVLLARAIELTRSPDERQMLENLVPQLESHWHSADNGDARLPPTLVSALIRVDELFAAKAEAQSHRAQTIDMTANVLGVAIAVLLAAGVLFFLWTLNQFVFGPNPAAGQKRRSVRGGGPDGPGPGHRRRRDPPHRRRPEHHGRRPGADARGSAALCRDRGP